MTTIARQICLEKRTEKRVDLLLNRMSSPGSGKTTTTVLRTIEALKNAMQAEMMEADIDSDADTRGSRENNRSRTGICYRVIP